MKKTLSTKYPIDLISGYGTVPDEWLYLWLASGDLDVSRQAADGKELKLFGLAASAVFVLVLSYMLWSL